MSFSTLVREMGGVTVIDFVGRITLGPSVTEVRSILRETLSSGSRQIVLNLALVDYVDSSGLGELISAYTSACNSGAEVKLASLQKRPRDLLQLTKLYTVFSIYPDEKSALASFRPR